MTEQDLVFYLDPLKVSVREGLDRYRRDLGDLDELGKSLQELGQIQPIVINRQNELIVGGRRLAACILRSIKVRAIYEDTVDPVRMKIWEWEENLRRKDLTAAEYSLGVDTYHTLMQELRGTAVSGREGGHTLDDTAKMLKKTRGSVISELEMAEMIKAFPELKQAKTKSEIKKAAKGLQKLDAAMKGLEHYEEELNKGVRTFELRHMDAIEHMKSLPDGCKDILLTDPLYGISADKIMIGLGGKTGGALTSAGYKISDEQATAIRLLLVLAAESFRFTTAKAHGYIFCGPEHFWTLRQTFMEVGWRVHVKPIIWTKREVGQCNVPSAWPSSCYEMLMYIRKDESKMVKEGQKDWIECPPVLPEQKLHLFEKPVLLLLDLLERVSLPGQSLYDPFAGSGSSIIAGLKMKLICEGVDNSLEAYSTMVKRVKEYVEAEQE